MSLVASKASFTLPLTLYSHPQFCLLRQPLHNDGERNAGWCEICAWGIGGVGLGGICLAN